MITPGNVGVGEPSTVTKRIDNARLTQPAPDAESVERQLIGLGDAENWANIAKVTDDTPAAGDFGLVVRPVGADDNYNSGIIDVPDTMTPVTPITTRVTAVLLFNDSTQIRHLSLRDGIANTYITDLPVPAKSITPYALHGAPFASGISWQVKSGQTGLRAQIVGKQ